MLVIGATLALASCGSSSSGSSNGSSSNVNKASVGNGTVLFGSLPPAGTPISGGVLTVGQLSGTTPTYVFPIIPGADSSVGTGSLVSNLFIPLYTGPSGAQPKIDEALSAAEAPVFSDGDRMVTITIKPGLKWGNGAPVDANDVAFEYYLLKAAIAESSANWGQFAPGVFPLNVVSLSTPSKYTIVFKLNKPTNPGWFLNNNLQTVNNVYPLPSTAWNIDSPNGPHLDYTNPTNAKKIFDFLSKAGSSVATFASNPLWQDGDGPFKLRAFSAVNSSYTLVPNPNYSLSPKPVYAQLQVQTYTGYTSELNAVTSGAVDIATAIDPSQLAEAPALRSQGIDLYGGPGWGWFGAIINFKDASNDFNHVIAQLYVRQAIDHVINEPEIIAGAYKGAAVAAYGPIPSAPTSPYTPPSAVNPPYPYDPAAAVALLRAHGWKVVPNGTTTCVKPGTASDECGAGIPAGTPITFVWANQPESASTTGVLESEAVASEAKAAAGINIQLQTKTFNFLSANYDDQNPAASKYTNDWGVNNFGGVEQDYYPTQLGVESPVSAGFNFGYYNDPTADALVQHSIFSSNPSAVEAEATYYATHLPVFYMPDPDYLLAVNTNKVGGDPQGYLALTQQQLFPQFFYLKKP